MKNSSFSQLFDTLKTKIFGNTEGLLPKTLETTQTVKTVLQSTITCPTCGHRKEETMPTDSCQFFYECEQCKTRLKPLQGDCCVFCSYGTVPCPPIQHDKKSCC